MKKPLDLTDIDSLMAVDLPDRNLMDTNINFAVTIDAFDNWAILDGNQISVLNNSCDFNGLYIGNATFVSDDSGNTYVMCWQDNQQNSQIEQEVTNNIIQQINTGASTGNAGITDDSSSGSSDPPADPPSDPPPDDTSSDPSSDASSDPPPDGA